MGYFFTASMYTIATAARQLPWAKKRLKSIQVIKGQRYCDSSEAPKLRGANARTFDLYAPKNYRSAWLRELQKARTNEDSLSGEPLPFVLYIHGGGFRTLSKETHWSFGLRFAEEGFVVFMINYRLTPDYPCPAGLEDCAIALDWILKHHQSLNIALDQGMIAGESAGGHLTLALALALTRPDPSPWAQLVYQHQWTPRMIAPSCAFLDIESSGRDRGEMHPFYQTRLDALGRAYLKGCKRKELALPLQELASIGQLERPFPPTLITVGGADVVRRDSERLAEQLARLGLDHKLIVYPKGIHAFHALITHPLAIQCWRDHFEFWTQQLRDHLIDSSIKLSAVQAHNGADDES